MFNWKFIFISILYGFILIFLDICCPHFFLSFHFLHRFHLNKDILTGFFGQSVSLSFHFQISLELRRVRKEVNVAGWLTGPPSAVRWVFRRHFSPSNTSSLSFTSSFPVGRKRGKWRPYVDQSICPDCLLSSCSCCHSTREQTHMFHFCCEHFPDWLTMSNLVLVSVTFSETHFT